LESGIVRFVSDLCVPYSWVDRNWHLSAVWVFQIFCLSLPRRRLLLLRSGILW